MDLVVTPSGLGNTNPEQLRDVLNKSIAMAAQSHGWKNKGCGISHYPRSKKQIEAQKHRLRAFFFLRYSISLWFWCYIFAYEFTYLGFGMNTFRF